MRQYIGGLSVDQLILKNQLCKVGFRKEEICCVPSDQNENLIVHLFYFTGEPLLRTAFRRQTIPAGGRFSRVAVGNGSDIKAVRVIKHFVWDAIPLAAELPSAGIIERLAGMMHILRWGLADLHNFGVRVTGYDGVRCKTKLGLAVPTAEKGQHKADPSGTCVTCWFTGGFNYR